MMDVFPGRVGIIERAVTPYRVPVYDALAGACQRGLSVTGGKPAPGEELACAERLNVANLFRVKNRNLLTGRFYLCWQSGLRDWLESWQPDAVIVDANPRFLSTPGVVRWMHKRGRPIMGWGLGVMQLTPGFNRLRHFGRRQFMRLFDGMFAYSTRAAEQYAALGVPADQIFVCKNAATMRPTKPVPARSPSFRERPVVLFVGKLTDVKRVDLLIQACAALPWEIKPRLNIVGDGPEAGSLKSLAERIHPMTQFFGARHGSELDAIFDDADLFVLPGLGGLAIQEAMSHGLPVIVAEGDGTQDDLVNPKNGWNVQPGNLHSLVDAIRRALSDPAKLRAMGEESYRIVANEINIEKMIETLLHGLNTTCERFNRGKQGRPLGVKGSG